MSGAGEVARDATRETAAADPTDATSRSGSSPDGRRCEWRLRSVQSVIPGMRRELRAFLAASGLPDDEREDLVLAACEAGTNALEHAQQPTQPFFDVLIEVADGLVTIVVRDHGQWQQPTSNPYRRRGLAMMHALAHTTVTTQPYGTTVTLRNHRAGQDAPAEEVGRAS
jgi:anti-sigma regulatory factor (Ser/Thr protein kinase)